MLFDSLEECCRKLTLLYIDCVSNRSIDVYTVDDSLRDAIRLRQCINSVQIYGYDKFDDGSSSIEFMLSPNYLWENRDFAFRWALGYLKWQLLLPPYDLGDDMGEIEDEGLVEWLSKGKVTILEQGPYMKQLPLDEFIKSFPEFKVR